MWLGSSRSVLPNSREAAGVTATLRGWGNANAREGLYSIIVTDKHAECRDFYVRWLDFDVVFERRGSSISRRREITPLALHSWHRIIPRSRPDPSASLVQGISIVVVLDALRRAPDIVVPLVRRSPGRPQAPSGSAPMVCSRTRVPPRARARTLFRATRAHVA